MSSTQDSLEVHRHSDVDRDRMAQHHTLGPGPNQSAPGNHTHSASRSFITSSSTQSLANGTPAAITGWPAETPFGNIVGGVLTFTKSGIFLVSAQVSFAANVTGRRLLDINHNGTGDPCRLDLPSGGNCTLNLTTALIINVNDTLQLIATQTSGGSLALAAAPTHHLHLVKLGEL